MWPNYGRRGRRRGIISGLISRRRSDSQSSVHSRQPEEPLKTAGWEEKSFVGLRRWNTWLGSVTYKQFWTRQSATEVGSSVCLSTFVRVGTERDTATASPGVLEVITSLESAISRFRGCHALPLCFFFFSRGRNLVTLHNNRAPPPPPSRNEFTEYRLCLRDVG